GRVAAWLASIDAACEVVRAQGCKRVVVCGVRLGALLAVIAAGRRTDIAGVATIAAVTSGRAYLREAKMMQNAMGLALRPAADGADELVGFALTEETKSALNAIDLVKSLDVPAPSMLVVDRDDLPASDKWIASLRARGVAVQHERLPGYVEMVLDPHKTEVPDRIASAVVAYASMLAARESSVAAPASTPLSTTHDREEVIEVAGLRAIASRPETTNGTALILLNAGAVRRIGPNRLHVMLARELADTLVIRADLSGLGDSPGAPDNMVYSDRAVADVGALVAWAKGQGAKRIVVGGLCSGAYHAQKAAAAGQPIDRVIAINPLTFFWTPDTPLDATSARVTSEAKRYGESAMSAAAWKKLLRGQVDVRRVAGILGRRVRNTLEHRGRELLRKLRVPLPLDLGTELAKLHQRGVGVHFIFVPSDPGEAMLREEGGSIVNRAVTIENIEGPDHTFTPRWSHPVLIAAIKRAL
ncbi:MAG TPA: alpha/beta fold hydrolase, partial [Kofleriaceae bacterium]